MTSTARSTARASWAVSAIAAGVLIAGGAVEARAQEASEGAGFPVGEKSRLHTSIDLGGAYDTNPDRTRAAEAEADIRGIIRPGLRFVVPGRALDLSVAAGVTISQYAGMSTRDPHTDVGGDIQVHGQVGGQDSLVGMRLRDDFTRTPAFIGALGAVASEERTYRAWFNRGEAALLFRPGGGALELSTGYTNELFFYDTLPNSQQHGVLAGAKLAFLPKTAMFVRGDLGFFSTDESMFTLKSSPFTVKAGVIGQVTSRFSALLEAGYGDTLTWEDGYFNHLSTKNRRTAVGSASLTWTPLDSLELSLGYAREVRPVITFNNVGIDALNGRFQWSIGAHVQIGLLAHVEFRHFAAGAGSNQIAFPTIDPTRNRPARDALLVLGDARLSYWWTEYLATAIGYRLLHQKPDDETGATSFLLSDYTRHQAFLTVHLAY